MAASQSKPRQNQHLDVQVSHLVIVETDRMFYLQRMREYYQQCMRDPIAISHGDAVAAANARQSQVRCATSVVRGVHHQLAKHDESSLALLSTFSMLGPLHASGSP